SPLLPEPSLPQAVSARAARTAMVTAPAARRERLGMGRIEVTGPVLSSKTVKTIKTVGLRYMQPGAGSLVSCDSGSGTLPPPSPDDYLHRVRAIRRFTVRPVLPPALEPLSELV